MRTWLKVAAVGLLIGATASAVGFRRFKRNEAPLEKLPNGSNCSFANDCTSGFCVDNKCCNSSCAGACDACSIAAGASVEGTCAAVADAHVGNPVCTPYLCDGSATSCPGTCATNADCATSYVCVSNACVVDYAFRMLWTGPALADQCTGTFPTGTVEPASISIATTHSGTSTCAKSDGTWVTLSADTPNIEQYGLSSEASFFNRNPRSDDMTAWTAGSVTVTSNTDAAPDGRGTIADTISSVGAAGAYIQSPTFSSVHGNFVQSWWAKTTSGTQAVQFDTIDTTASVTRLTSTPTLTTTWQRLQTISTFNQLIDSNNHVMRIYPGGAAGEGTIVVVGIQGEAAARSMSSIVPTTGAAASHGTSRYSINPLPARWPVGTGSLTVDITAKRTGTSGGGTQYIADCIDAAANGWGLLVSSGGTMNFTMRAGGSSTTRSQTTSTAWAAGEVRRYRIEWTPTTVDMYENGVAKASTGTITAVTATNATCYIGSNSGDSNVYWKRYCVSDLTNGCQ